MSNINTLNADHIRIIELKAVGLRYEAEQAVRLTPELVALRERQARRSRRLVALWGVCAEVLCVGAFVVGTVAFLLAIAGLLMMAQTFAEGVQV